MTLKIFVFGTLLSAGYAFFYWLGYRHGQRDEMDSSFFVPRPNRKDAGGRIEEPSSLVDLGQ